MSQEVTLERQMLQPIRELMRRQLGVNVVYEEFSSGYGVADLVGGSIPPSKQRLRENIGVREALDDRLVTMVLLAIRPKGRTSMSTILGRVPVSESTLTRVILPRLTRAGIVERYTDGYVSLRVIVPNPADQIVAIEAKQTRWREAILQARRYTFFANQTYVAVWNGTVEHVDRTLLYRHRIGLVGVERKCASVIIEAPVRSPRERTMHRYCAERLYAELIR